MTTTDKKQHYEPGAKYTEDVYKKKNREYQGQQQGTADPGGETNEDGDNNQEANEDGGYILEGGVRRQTLRAAQQVHGRHVQEKSRESRSRHG